MTSSFLRADGVQDIAHKPIPMNPHEVPLKSRDGSRFFLTPHPSLATDRTRFVGQEVVMVVAESAASARDSAERVIVDWEPLPAVVTAADALANGAPRALWELCAYDRETGQMQAATFMDYALPRADHFPPFHCEISEVPSTSNPLGLRGGGEGGTTPALGVVINAIVDALAELGVEHLEMPATPERVWRAIQTATRPR